LNDLVHGLASWIEICLRYYNLPPSIGDVKSGQMD
jgi:hypothetical protein